MDRFARTREALVKYDGGEEAREACWSAIETDADLLACDRMDKAALDEVREAFALDTADCNSRDQAMIAGLRFMRSCAEGGVAS